MVLHSRSIILTVETHGHYASKLLIEGTQKLCTCSRTGMRILDPKCGVNNVPIYAPVRSRGNSLFCDEIKYAIMV